LGQGWPSAALGSGHSWTVIPLNNTHTGVTRRKVKEHDGLGI